MSFCSYGLGQDVILNYNIASAGKRIFFKQPASCQFLGMHSRNEHSQCSSATHTCFSQTQSCGEGVQVCAEHIWQGRGRGEIQAPLDVSPQLRATSIFQRPEGTPTPPPATGPNLPGRDCDAAENWLRKPGGDGRGENTPCLLQEDEREPQCIFFLFINFTSSIQPDMSILLPFIHDHFNPGHHRLFPGLLQLSPRQSPCLYSSSYNSFFK